MRGAAADAGFAVGRLKGLLTRLGQRPAATAIFAEPQLPVEFLTANGVLQRNARRLCDRQVAQQQDPQQAQACPSVLVHSLVRAYNACLGVSLLSGV